MLYFHGGLQIHVYDVLLATETVFRCRPRLGLEASCLVRARRMQATIIFVTSVKFDYLWVILIILVRRRHKLPTQLPTLKVASQRRIIKPQSLIFNEAKRP